MIDLWEPLTHASERMRFAAYYLRGWDIANRFEDGLERIRLTATGESV